MRLVHMPLYGKYKYQTFVPSLRQLISISEMHFGLGKISSFYLLSLNMPIQLQKKKIIFGTIPLSP